MASSLEIETLTSSSIPIDSFDHAIQLLLSSVLPMSVRSAVDLGLFNIISKAGGEAGISASDIAAEIRTINPEALLMLDRMLRFLTSHSLLSCSVINGQRFYSLTPVSKYFVINEDGASLGPWNELVQSNVFMNSWFEVKDAVVKGGVPFVMAHGKNAYQYANLNPEFNQIFNSAMVNLTTLFMRRVLDTYKGFENLTQVVDVGGNLGVALGLITSRYPNIKGINYDLPHVIQHAPHYPGVKHVGGDVFSNVPSGEAIFMKNVLHSFLDEQCIKILKNCYKAIPYNGKVIVVETLIPVGRDTSLAEKLSLEYDVLMLIQAPKGKERTQLEYVNLATAAGFSDIKFEFISAFVCVMEFIKE